MHYSVAESFTGDGRYKGDGGADLQRLWEQHDWTEIKCCPGRYTSSSRTLRTTPPEVVISMLRSEKPMLLSEQRVCSLPGKDDLFVARFAGGGGLLTYIKTSKFSFVHTLNTESGMYRKLMAMKVGITATAEDPPHVTPLLNVLSFLTNVECNHSAHLLVLLFKDIIIS